MSVNGENVPKPCHVQLLRNHKFACLVICGYVGEVYPSVVWSSKNHSDCGVVCGGTDASHDGYGFADVCLGFGYV